MRRTRADCTVRALATVANLNYEEADRLAADAGRERGRRFSAQRVVEYSKRRGLKWEKLRFGVRSTERFCRENPTGRYYVRVRGHAFAIIDGVTFDGSSKHARITDAWRFLGGEVMAKPERVKVEKPPVDKKALKYGRTLAAIKRWTTKAKRADTALKKLRRSLRAQERAMSAQPTTSTTVH